MAFSRPYEVISLGGAPTGPKQQVEGLEHSSMSTAVEQSTSASWQPAIVRIQNKFQTNVIRVNDHTYKYHDYVHKLQCQRQAREQSQQQKTNIRDKVNQ